MIATDLHDDIGSNLSKISVLSEVVRMQINNDNTEQNRLLNSIAEISRQSVSSMSDIVWAINPKRDSLLEMIRKMREHAEEILVPKNIHVKFTEPEANAKIKLPMHLRRDLYLIFKEAVNNVAKHSKCTKVVIDFKIEYHEIVLKIEDNGIGFDQTNQMSGNGLANMLTRVEKLKGTLKIDANINRGTTLLIHIPQK
jgi:signal transduction histidine kinase